MFISVPHLEGNEKYAESQEKVNTLGHTGMDA